MSWRTPFRLVLGFTDQHMEGIEWADIGPHCWQPEALPDVDDVRPRRCRRCGSPAKEGGRIVVQGHGHPGRQVVVLPAVGDQADLVAECWSRRYRCTRCHAVPTVLPPGVLPRFLYSALAIVAAFWCTEAGPVGQGLTDAEAYAVQGMYPRPCWTKPWPYRWRSLDRWRARIPAWWPGVQDASGLLVELLRRAGCRDFQRVLAVSVRSHARWGAAM